MQEFFKQQADFAKIWQGNQEEMTKQYTGWTEKWWEDTLGNKQKAPDFSAGWFKTQQTIMERFQELGDRMNGLVHDGDNFSNDYLKLMNLRLFEENYKNFLANMGTALGVPLATGDAGAWQEAGNLYRSFMEKGNPLLSALGITKIADAINNTLGILQGSWGQGENTLIDVMKNYQNLMGGLSEKATSLSIDGLIENLDACKQQIEKYLSAPPLGLNREIIQDAAKGLELSLDYVLAYGKLAKVAEAASRQASAAFQKSLSEMAANKKPVAKFTELFALWTKESEPVIIDFLRSEEFAKSQGDFIDAGHRLNIQWTRLAEKVLEPTPVALKRDLDLAIAEIHRLKREMRSLRQEVKETHRKTAAATGGSQNPHDGGDNKTPAALNTKAPSAGKSVRKVEPKLRPKTLTSRSRRKDSRVVN